MLYSVHSVTRHQPRHELHLPSAKAKARGGTMMICGCGCDDDGDDDDDDDSRTLSIIGASLIP